MISISGIQLYLKDWVANNSDICPNPADVDQYFSGSQSDEYVSRQRSDLKEKFASLSTGEGSRMNGSFTDLGTAMRDKVKINFCVVKACNTSNFSEIEAAKNWGHEQIVELVRQIFRDASGVDKCDFPDIEKVDLKNVPHFEVGPLGTGQHFGWGCSFEITENFY